MDYRASTGGVPGPVRLLLATLFLIMSTSRVFVVAQQVTLNQAGAAGSTAMGLPATNTSAMQVAAILSNVFRDVSSNFAAVATGAPASASPVGAVPTTPSQPLSSNATLDPSIVQLLNQSMAAGMPANVVTAIQKALLQQQQAGSDLGTLQGAARTVASFLSLPATLGTGANIRDFTARIDQLRALRDSVKTQHRSTSWPAPCKECHSTGFPSQQLLLDITSKAADIYTPQAACPHSLPSAQHCPSSQLKPVVAWAFSNQATGGLSLVNGLLTAVTDGMSMFSGITNTLG
ncbi:hypothetical protein V8C86DRAFT_3036189 [Haematococcus lacustris]